MEFIFCIVVFLAAATGLFFPAVMLWIILFGGRKPIGFPMVIVGLVMLIYLFVQAVRSIPSFKKILPLQSRHFLLAIAWGCLFGFSIALFWAGNMIIVSTR
jgi:hypothetical protein